MKSSAESRGFAALKTMLRAVADTVFPPRCARCRAYVDAHGQWCPRCLRAILDPRKIGLDGQKSGDLDAAFILCRYHGGLQKLIGSLKYHHKTAVLPHLESLLVETRLLDARSFDFIVPVPLTAEKIRTRGFNQAEKIFYPWSRRVGVAWLDALLRTRETAPQYNLGRQARQKNLRGAFRIKETICVANKDILLVDDIFTTGMTMRACAKALKKAGAARVAGLALAGDG